MIKRIKNWLIKKLGGKTKTEWENAVYSGLVSLQRAKKYKKNYEEEHETYLALLNCHNATAEVAQKQLDVTEMAKAIKAHCAGRDDCEDCELHDADINFCKLGETACPCYWEVE